VRILVTITPRMYREAIALYLLQHRPAYEVRIGAPGAVEKEVRAFAPRLLVHNDIEGLEARVLINVHTWVEVLYSNGMDARISVEGRTEEISNISMEVLLRVADEAAAGMLES
jgi:hypothetical protein